MASFSLHDTKLGVVCAGMVLVGQLTVGSGCCISLAFTEPEFGPGSSWSRVSLVAQW